ncbi:CobW family GTP-binding protein [Saccharicrinis sp. FJH62]|uniref:CobW family GTP-binding protein n=1 Tax=Saccharicrinis sp. FJH62 TaxID=3344657 RepID=UPI0035D43E0E
MSIPLHLVTGFLGSGKTSFLTHYLKKAGAGQHIAIIQNEFSPVNIDGRQFTRHGEYNVLEINNGSVFCVCLLGSFVGSLLRFIEKYNPDLLLMETSGLSDTIGVGQIFQSKELAGKVFLDHVWCMVDAKHFDKIPALKLRLDHQLRSADTIILNKVDLVENTDELMEQIRTINPFARIMKGTFGQISLDTQKKALNLFPSDQNEALGRPDVGSYVIRSNQPINREKLTAFFDRFKTDCMRCKGYVKMNDGNTLMMQGVMGDLNTEPIRDYSGNTEFVIIGHFRKDENLQVVFDEYCKA